jgi:hypothetical protein
LDLARLESWVEEKQYRLQDRRYTHRLADSSPTVGSWDGDCGVRVHLDAALGPFMEWGCWCFGAGVSA